jgi:DNA-binding NtrC family response regulator/tetratricopeptide (TPR) repeat protein
VEVFLDVAERSALYGTMTSRANELALLSEHYANSDALVTACVGLALIYSKRIHSEEHADELIDRIAALAIQGPEDSDVRRLSRLVHATILLTLADRLVEGLDILTRLHEELRYTENGPMYGLVRRWMGLAFMGSGRPREAQVAYQDAISVCRRYGLRFTYAAALNDYAVLRKRSGYYGEAHALLIEAKREFSELGASRNVLYAIANLGLLAMRVGDWRGAGKHFMRAEELLAKDGLEAQCRVDSQLRSLCVTSVEQLLMLQRSFEAAEERLTAVVAMQEVCPSLPRILAVTHERLGELYIETASYEKASYHLECARALAAEIAEESDLMAEILRREAQLQLLNERFEQGLETAKLCIRLCLRINDRYELGAAQRVLAELHVAGGCASRADSCFRAAVKTLKGIHECYELMRTLYAQGKFLLTQGKQEDAELSLLEARQLAKRLELDYYQALVAIALVDTLGPQERFDEANAWLVEATSLRDNLEGIDRERVETELKRAAGELQVAMTRASVRSAEVLKTICRVYEDARFPFEDLKPDLAYQVAQSVGAESLFVIGRCGGGYRVPLTYNIAINDAKEIIRQMDRDPRKATLLGVKGEPKVLHAPNGKTLVAVPCRHQDMDRRDPTSYILCTRFEELVTITPRQLELLGASAEALARLIEDEEERRGHPPGEGDEETIHVRHPRGSFKDIQTIDPEMIKVIRMAERAATSVTPILLEGETGVGKELFARAIHGASKRKDAAFVAINAGGLSVHLIESELFGHVKGAFTGANGDRVGLIETARGGTLFLDEIGEMSEELQVKLLRLLENGEFRRLGESAVRQADVRVISATNRDLKKELDHGAFRRDLFYRVSPIRLTIPPLRLRSRDIQLLVRHFLRDCAALNGIADRYIEIDVKAMEALELYDWPGNVRELYNEILRVVSLIGRGDLVRFAMLSDNIKEYLKSKNRGDGLLDRSVEQYERRLILNALDKNDWNRMRTADSVGVPRTTLIAKLKRLNVATK